MDEELVYQIGLQLVYSYRVRTALQMLEHYGSARAVWERSEIDNRKELLDRAKREADFVHTHGISTYFCTDSAYPYRLRECPDRPLLLYGKGNLSLNEGKMISVVGTRNATDRGKELTRQFVLDLARQVDHPVIISGLAYGIDVAAHRAAIEAGIPTVIIPAHGLDRIYPPQHRPVAVQSLAKGGILTEYPSETEPERHHFVARNRIIAGLADAVVIVESKERGGSLITANMAIDYARDLFAFPGRPSDEHAVGCNRLIQNNKAFLLQNAQDLVVQMNWQQQAPPLSVQMEIDLFGMLTPNQQLIINKLHEEEDGLHINIIVMETQLPYSTVSSELMMLELNEWVKSLPGGIYRALK